MATLTESHRSNTLSSNGPDQSTRAHPDLTTSTASSNTAMSAAPAASSNSNSTTDMSAPAPPPAPAQATAGEPMDIAAPHSDTSNNNGNNTSPGTGAGQADADTDGQSNDRSKNASPPNNILNMSAPPPAAAALHQPKIVQTAFIHKLYNMLEDQNIQHLISWSSSADSFVMAPTPDFSKVLSQYFKHTNISSFVRQLNMYGFHKERDVFHTGNPESTLWEFKHGGGNFKRGDLVGLREIKRRASRHALVHRENNYPKATTSQPGTPAEPLHLNADSGDGRSMASIEHTLYDINERLRRSEENTQYLGVRNQMALDTVSRLLYFNQELARSMQSLAPLESQVHRDVASLSAEMQRQVDLLRSMEDEPPLSSRQQYFSGLDNAPLSPRQMAQDDGPRRGNLTVPQRQNFYKPPVPSNLSVGSRRPYGSIGGGSTTQSSPSRNPNIAAPPQPHPLSNVEPHPSSLGRRHTSADIRAHGWQPGMSPFASNTPTAYPSSPSRVPPEDQRIRESLSSYSLQNASQNPNSRPTTPPPFANNAQETFGNWSWGSAAASRGLKDSSAPPTRRGSMAHILNPSDTAERSDEDEDPRGEDDRKRKRMQ